MYLKRGVVCVIFFFCFFFLFWPGDPRLVLLDSLIA